MTVSTRKNVQNSNILHFRGEQSFSGKQVLLLLILINIILVIPYFIQVYKSGSATNNAPESFLASAVAAAVITLLLKSFKLVTEIRTDGIYIRFTPLHRNFKICL